MKTLIEQATEMLKQAQLLTHLNLPDDLQSYIDAATQGESTAEFVTALESHKQDLRRQAIALLDQYLTNEYYKAEQIQLQRKPRNFALSEFAFDKDFNTELATLQVDGTALNLKVTRDGMNQMKNAARAQQFREFSSNALQVELPDMLVSELNIVFKLFGV